MDAEARSIECASFGKIAVPFSPDESLIYTKLTSPPCGSLMPFAIEPLDPEAIEKIRAWIELGAP